MNPHDGKHTASGDAASDVTIRKAVSGDSVPVQVLMSTYFLDIEGLPIDEFIVALLGERIIGAAYLQTGKITEIHSVAVHPNYRGKGIGHMLLYALLSQVKDVDFIFTRTTSPVFFEKAGFKKLDDSEKAVLWEDCAGCDRLNTCKQSVLRLDIRYKGR
ncbi:GNAT family N-acetyltransferase [Methanolobus sp. WCC5]|uniref:GNAT family N-acetyltransferase n=1 Tax=Methanolobus sp. WCC5 TaxID=3125785 RepID=UPI003249F22A